MPTQLCVTRVTIALIIEITALVLLEVPRPAKATPPNYRIGYAPFPRRHGRLIPATGLGMYANRRPEQAGP